jgi:hypothetical protein
MEQAEEALHKLYDEGFPLKHVSIVAQHPAGGQGIHGWITTGEDLTPYGAATGAWVGGLLSLLVGAAILWIPQVGSLLVVGRLAGLLLASVEGALAGAAAGSFLGALANWGVAEEHILDYEKQVQGGNYLVIVHGDAEEIAQAHAVLQGTTAGKLHLHASTKV